MIGLSHNNLVFLDLGSKTNGILFLVADSAAKTVNVQEAGEEDALGKSVEKWIRG